MDWKNCWKKIKNCSSIVMLMVVTSLLIVQNAETTIYLGFIKKLYYFFKSNLSDIFITIFSIIALLLIIDKNQDIKRYILPIIGFTIVISLTLLSKSEWCYLAAIIIAGYSTNIISKELLKEFKDCINAFHGRGQTEKITSQEDMDKVDKKNANIVQNSSGETMAILKSQGVMSRYEGYMKYKMIENAAIKQLQQITNIPFEQQEKIILRNKHVIYPDAIMRYPQKDIIVEVKYPSLKNYSSSLRAGFEQIRKYINYYDNSVNVEFYLVIVVSDNITEHDELKLQKQFDKLILQYIETSFFFKLFIFKDCEILK